MSFKNDVHKVDILYHIDEMIQIDKVTEMQLFHRCLKSDTSLQIVYTLHEKCCTAVVAILKLQGNSITSNTHSFSRVFIKCRLSLPSLRMKYLCAGWCQVEPNMAASHPLCSQSHNPTIPLVPSFSNYRHIFQL